MQKKCKWLSGADRGNALVLAVLILLTLTSVGVVSVQRTNTDVIVAGNIARATQAFLGSDAGMQHGLALVGDNPQWYLSAVSRERIAGGSSTNNDLTYPVVSSTTAATAAPAVNAQTPLMENFWMSTVDSANPKAPMHQQMAYQVISIWVGENKGLAGSSMDADICQEVYDFNAQGGIPTRNESVAQTMQQMDTIVVMSRARAMTGPCKCTK